jgi:hypothetical protein
LPAPPAAGCWVCSARPAAANERFPGKRTQQLEVLKRYETTSGSKLRFSGCRCGANIWLSAGRLPRRLSRSLLSKMPSKGRGNLCASRAIQMKKYIAVLAAIWFGGCTLPLTPYAIRQGGKSGCYANMPGISVSITPPSAASSDPYDLYCDTQEHLNKCLAIHDAQKCHHMSAFQDRHPLLDVNCAASAKTLATAQANSWRRRLCACPVSRSLQEPHGDLEEAQDELLRRMGFRVLPSVTGKGSVRSCFMRSTRQRCHNLRLLPTVKEDANGPVVRSRLNHAPPRSRLTTHGSPELPR